MTDNTATKYRTAISLKKENPSWSMKKCCAKAKISVPSFYEAKKEIEGLTTVVLPSSQITNGIPTWKQIVKSNLPTQTKMDILNTL